MKVSCDVIQDLLPLYTDQAASADTVALVEEHLASCPACREGSWGAWGQPCRRSRRGWSPCGASSGGGGGGRSSSP